MIARLSNVVGRSVGLLTGLSNTWLHLQGAPQRLASDETPRPHLRALSGASHCWTVRRPLLWIKHHPATLEIGDWDLELTTRVIPHVPKHTSALDVDAETPGSRVLRANVIGKVWLVGHASSRDRLDICGHQRSETGWRPTFLRDVLLD